MCDKHHFEFEIDLAIRSQVISQLEASPEHPLTLDVAPAASGVYALYRNGKLVYVGKAMGDTTLKRRLGEHFRKIAGRSNIDTSEMTCRFLEIESPWFVRAAEDALIVSYREKDLVEWNGSGFGLHDPGAGRPGIRVPKWDQDFPPREGAPSPRRRAARPP